MESSIRPKCKYCDVELVKEHQNYRLPRGEKGQAGLNVNYGKDLEAFSCPRCGYTDFFYYLTHKYPFEIVFIYVTNVTELINP